MPIKTRKKNYEIYFGGYNSGHRHAKKVELNDSSLILYRGDEFNMYFTVTPVDGLYTSIEWSSTNPEIVDIDENGHITALRAGISIISIKINRSVSKCKVTVKEVIQFKDPIVKSILVRNFDTDGDGEISYTEANMVTNIPFPMFTGMPITSFNELVYFRNLKTIGEHAFDSCKDLAYIKFPNSLERINKNAFSYCDSLTEITVTPRVKSIGSNAFSDCENLTVAYIHNLTPPTAGERIFDRDPSLDRIYVPGDKVDDYLNAINWGMLNDEEYLYYSYIIYQCFDYPFDFFLS